jgi:hypothetical protein
MKLADAVKARGDDAKADMVEYSKNNKLEKPATEAIIVFKTSLEDHIDDISTGEEVANSKTAKAHKKKKKGGAPNTLFKKKLQLKLSAGEGNGDKEEDNKDNREEVKEVAITEEQQSEMIKEKVIEMNIAISPISKVPTQQEIKILEDEKITFK